MLSGLILLCSWMMWSVPQFLVRGLRKQCTGFYILWFSYHYIFTLTFYARTTRWLDRCLKAHKRPESQNLFPIVQGGLDAKLRTESAKQLMQRDVAGFAIGGLR